MDRRRRSRRLRGAGGCAAFARFLLAGSCCIGGATPILAEPYLAMRSGLNCSACHANQTGGGLRTAHGVAYGRESLPAWIPQGAEGLFDGLVTERLRVGTDLRAEYRGNLRDEGPYLGEYRLTSANLYLGVQMIPDRLSFYVDERVAPGGALNREAFALLRLPRAQMYAKAGKFFPPFGLRLQDDDAATRRFTGFNFDSQDIGIEVGAEPGPWSLHLAVTNGTAAGAETDNGKQVSALAAVAGDHWRLGASASNNDLPGAARRSLGGVFGGVRAGPLVVLAEWDAIRHHAADASQVYSEASHFEVDWTPHRGVTFRAWVGVYDPSRRAGGDRQAQRGVGGDWTVLSGLQLRGYYRRRDGPAGVLASRDDQTGLEVHAYF